jgi:hypothetical protein
VWTERREGQGKERKEKGGQARRCGGLSVCMYMLQAAASRMYGGAMDERMDDESKEQQKLVWSARHDARLDRVQMNE